MREGDTGEAILPVPHADRDGSERELLTYLAADVEHIDDSDICEDCGERHAGPCEQGGEVAELRRAVLLWAERFTPGDRWDSEDLRDLETALGGTVEAHPTAHWRREQAELRAEVERLRLQNAAGVKMIRALTDELMAKSGRADVASPEVTDV